MAPTLSSRFRRTNQGFACVSSGQSSPSPDACEVECRHLPTKRAANRRMNWNHLVFPVEPGCNPMASVPINGPKDDIVDLTAIIGTHGPPILFTIDRQMNRRGEVRFDERGSTAP
jgi:hypothetical protein